MKPILKTILQNRPVIIKSGFNKIKVEFNFIKENKAEYQVLNKNTINNNVKWRLQLPSSPQDWEVTSILVGRPLSLILLYPVRNFINPNVVTVFSLLLSLTASFLYFYESHIIAAGIILFFSMVLDDGDGLVARYRDMASDLGSFTDKTADVIRFGVLFSVLGHLAFKHGASPYILLVAGLTPFMLMVQGYTKWLNEAQILKKQPGKISEIKKETSEKSKIYYVAGILNAILWPFHECDLTVWIIVLSLPGKYELLIWILFTSQSVAALISLFVRTKEAFMRDQNHAI